MEKKYPYNENPNTDDVDIIRLLNYFKGGIKSIFRFFWKIIESILQFIVLLRKNWFILIPLTILGGLYGWYLQYNSFGNKKFEMVVKANPLSNIELYAFSAEVNSQNRFKSSEVSEGIKLAKKLGISEIVVEPIERSENVISDYFNQIEGNPLRADQTDTIFYLAYKIEDHKSNMDDFEFSLQKVKFNVNKDVNPQLIQEEFLNYINNVPGVKREQEGRLAMLKNYESVLKRNLENIDSLLASKTAVNKNPAAIGSDQLLVNTASRGTVEGDLLRYSEIFSKKLYGTQKQIIEFQNGVNIVSNLRLIYESKLWSNPVIKYTLFGLVLSCLLILLLQFNKYLNRFTNNNLQ